VFVVASLEQRGLQKNLKFKKKNLSANGVSGVVSLEQLGLQKNLKSKWPVSRSKFTTSQWPVVVYLLQACGIFTASRWNVVVYLLYEVTIQGAFEN